MIEIETKFLFKTFARSSFSSRIRINGCYRLILRGGCYLFLRERYFFMSKFVTKQSEIEETGILLPPKHDSYYF